NFQQVTYHGLYPGVDAVYYGNANRQLEYDFVVAPGADYHAIQLGLVGAQSTQLDAQGELLLNTAGGQLVQKAPTLYQLAGDGTKQPVTGRYAVTGSQLGFSVDSYDHSKALYIDPVLSFSTYLGGTGDDQGLAIAVDGAGNTYVAGSTATANFPTANPL